MHSALVGTTSEKNYGMGMSGIVSETQGMTSGLSGNMNSGDGQPNSASSQLAIRAQNNQMQGHVRRKLKELLITRQSTVLHEFEKVFSRKSHNMLVNSRRFFTDSGSSYHDEFLDLIDKLEFCVAVCAVENIKIFGREGTGSALRK